MPTHKCHLAPGQVQFLTSSTYRRAQLFESDRFRWSFVEVLGQFSVFFQNIQTGIPSNARNLSRIRVARLSDSVASSRSADSPG